LFTSTISLDVVNIAVACSMSMRPCAWGAAAVAAAKAPQ
jgi:hypothetical protein